MLGDVRPDTAREAFFEAMTTVGWAGSNPKVLHSEVVPVRKEVVYVGDNVKLIDRWSAKRHSQSSLGDDDHLDRW